jgi:diguanylate cyclase (GGDEF)-like protein
MPTKSDSPIGRILLVDDDPVVSEVIQHALTQDGHQIERCAGVAEALDQIQNQHYPVVITDLRLPDGSGADIMARSLRLHPHASVIVVTGDSHYATAAEAIEQGAYDYIPKPFDPAVVRLIVRRALERNVLLSERRRLEQLANTDALTNLGNRRLFEPALARELARCERYDGPLSLLLADVDGLRSCNEEHGHGAGDEMLRVVAGALVRIVRKADLLFRVGDDEFALLLPETPAEGAAVVAGRCCLAVATNNQTSWQPTVSLGRASFPDDARTADDLLAAADRHMYEAKQAGGNGYAPE